MITKPATIEIPADVADIWSYSAGEIDPAKFNLWAVPRRAKKPRPGNRRYSGTTGRIDICYPHLPPTMTSEGVIRCELTPNSYDFHCHVRPLNNDLLEYDGCYTQLGREYWHHLRVRVPSEHMAWAQRASWCVVMQHWQQDGTNPPFALMIKKGQWAVQQYGATAVVPRGFKRWGKGNSVDNSQNELSPLSADWQDVIIRYVPQASEGGETQVWIDDQEVYYQSGPNCLARPNNRGTMFTFGCYGSKVASAVEFSHVRYAA